MENRRNVPWKYWSLKKKGSLKFASLPQHIYNLFKLTYMNKVVDIFEDLETALKSFQVQ